ncbi:tumor protein D53-like isoform X1 [Acipenser oxyrinchus oxyrinchus]|uniref:Tumor protein D53-like isoform X1 n=1 Tax=Acipenser oxyrinchus oxyrinchus TaxID=40147 RepID=A0AAD8GAQ3_ACIOX|nr:tumor protein D53-like isoform X1 [Acipenser oxyrinchus oxyrinchus]
MEARQQGLLETQPLQEVDEDVVAALSNSVSDEEMQVELEKLEEEISTLRQVLTAKEKHHAELKQKLGVNPLSEFRQNFNKSWHEMQTSTAYKKTQETFSTAGQKASAAFSNVGTAIGRKFGDMSVLMLKFSFTLLMHSWGSYSVHHSMSMPAMRNSSSFKSFEEKVESTVSTLKSKVGVPSNSGGSFEEVLSSAAHASAQDTPAAATRLTESSEQQC